MGLFSSKKKHYVDTAVVRMVEDVMVPDALQTALVDTIIKGGDLIANINDQSLNGGHRKFDQMYKYAKNGDYFYGLPNARVLSSDDGYALAQAAIESDEGEAITDLEYIHFLPLNNVHGGFKHITEVLGYNQDSNEITGLSTTHGFTTYLDNIMGVTQSNSVDEDPEQSSQGSFGDFTGASMYNPFTKPARDITEISTQVQEQDFRVGISELESVEIHWIYQDDSDPEDIIEVTGFEVVDLSGYDSDQEYYQAKYKTASMAVGEWGYWVYDPLTGPHTALNDVFAPLSYTDPGTYFPFAMLRSEDANRGADGLEGTPEFDTTEKLMSYLGMDFKEMADSIDGDDDAKDLAQAVMMMGVPLTSTNQVDLEYLYLYFKDLSTKIPVAGTDLSLSEQQLTAKRASVDVAYAVNITDADFDVTISFDKIGVRYYVGELGPAGFLTNTVEYLDTMPIGLKQKKVAPYAVRVIRRQITKYMYEEIRVQNPQIRYTIYKNKGAEGGFDDERLIIPIDYAISKTMPVLETQTLYYRSLHLVFNSHVVVKEKWYESGIFKVIMVIVAVVITIYSAGSGSGVFAAVLAGTATTAMLVSLGMAVLTSIVEQMIIGFVIGQVIEVVGVEAGFWLAVAASVVAGGAAAKSLSTGGKMLTPLVTDMLTAATALTDGVSDELGELMAEYQEDVEKFNEYKEGKLEELDEINKLLDSGVNIDPFAFVGREPLALFGEPPDAYFNRTIHSGNVGIQGPNIIQNFVDISLRLPSTQETFGNTLYD